MECILWMMEWTSAMAWGRRNLLAPTPPYDSLKTVSSLFISKRSGCLGVLNACQNNQSWALRILLSHYCTQNKIEGIRFGWSFGHIKPHPISLQRGISILKGMQVGWGMFPVESGCYNYHSNLSIHKQTGCQLWVIFNSMVYSPSTSQPAHFCRLSLDCTVAYVIHISSYSFLHVVQPRYNLL